MSRFNVAAEGQKTTNLAGGQAYKQSPELELVSILLTSFAKDDYYRSGNETFERLKQLIAQCDKKFVAQAAIYARKEFGMRSITHVLASELARHISGQPWAKNFYTSVVHRPDDMMEILSYHLANNGKETAAMKKGLAQAFDKFDAYQLAKYRGEGKAMKLVDVVNLVHPVPMVNNAEALTGLVNGTLKSTETWEAKLTKAGQTASSEEEKLDLKKDAWTELVKSRKIGYFALLRNLRNILEQAPEVVADAIEMLTDEKLIRKSLVLPFRFQTAYAEVSKLTVRNVREVMVALNKAVDISVKNIPVFEGDTLVVLDVSGSMAGQPAEIGSLFAAALIKSNNADFIVFSDRAKYVNVNPVDSTMTIASSIKFAMGGTNFWSIFQTANKKYDRIIVLSDMQGWIGGHAPTQAVTEYKKLTGADPKIYSFDLKNYGSMQFPEQNVFAIAGFSEKVFDLMKMMEQDKNALISRIKQISL